MAVVFPEGPGQYQEGFLMVQQSMVLVDVADRRRSPASMPGYLAGRAPHNKGRQYPPDPPRAEEIIQVMRQAGGDPHGLRVRALVHRQMLPPGPLVCVIDGATRGRR